MKVSQKHTPNLDSVTTINADGSHNALHPADVKGKWTLARRLVGFALILVYVLLPWINVNGFPAVFMDLEVRRLHFFGLTFTAEDFWLGFFLITGLGFALFYLTSLFGRLWCGWTCPYTVFLEHVYRRIERLIEGDSVSRRKMDAAPWAGSKIVKRGLKHGIYILISLAIANVFMSYFVSLPKLYQYMTRSPAENWEAFAVVMFLTASLYFSFSWFREQFCIIICPYGRIQSALTDDHSTIIGYDFNRGEPRGKTTDLNAGDCISCNRCVQVCPTGIDIRDGLQLECIGCAACVDACDDIMDKVGRERGLIRYDSHIGLHGGKTKYVRPRIIFYTIFLVVWASVLAFSLTKVHDVNMVLKRMTGMPFFVDDTGVRNQFEVRIMTKRNQDTTFTLTVKDKPEWLVTSGVDGEVVLGPHGDERRPFFVQVPKADYTGPFKMTLVSESHPGGTVIERTVEFMGPDPRLFTE